MYLKRFVGQHPTINDEIRTRNPTRGGRGEEEAGIGDIFGLPQVSKRSSLEITLHPFGPRLS